MRTSEKIGRELLAAMDSQAFDSLRELLAEDVTMTGPGFDSQTGADAVLAVLQGPYGVFHDLEHRVVGVTVDEETVVFQLNVVATHNSHLTSEFGEFPPTGKKVGWYSAAFIMIDGEKVAKIAVYLDQIAMYRQLGYELSPKIN